MATVCIVPECEVKSVSKVGYCQKHYACWKRNGDPIPKQPQRLGCKVEGCTGKHRRNGFCDMHSARLYRHEDPTKTYPNKMTAEQRKEALKKSQREYDCTPKGRAAAVLKRHRRRHREGGEVLLTVEDVLAIKILFKFKCFNCDAKSDLCLDHHIPLAKGGKLTKDNVVILCRKCNGLKADLDPSEFYSREQLEALPQLQSEQALT